MVKILLILVSGVLVQVKPGRAISLRATSVDTYRHACCARAKREGFDAITADIHDLVAWERCWMVERPRRRPGVWGILWVAPVLVMSWLLAATAGCSGPEDTPPVQCAPGASTLSSLDPGTGQVTWQATLNQASESPMQVDDGAVVVSAPCGAAVVDLADGDVRYDDAIPVDHFGAIDVIGVIGNRLFTRDDPEGDRTGIRAIDLDTGKPGWSFSTNTRYQDATVAAGSLVTLYGNELAARDHTDLRRFWDIHLPACCPRLVHSGDLMLATGDDGSTFAVDLADGTLVWRAVPPVAAISYDLRVTSVPGTVLTSASTGDEAERFFVYATEARTGRLRWTRTAVSVLVADREITVLRTAEAVEAVDTDTGALLWSHPAPTVGYYLSIPTAALTTDTVVVPQAGSTAAGLDRRTGRMRWGGLETSTVLAAGEVVLALTEDGVIAIDARTGAERWSRTSERARQQFAVTPDGQLLLLDSDMIPQPAMEE